MEGNDHWRGRKCHQVSQGDRSTGAKNIYPFTPDSVDAYFGRELSDSNKWPQTYLTFSDECCVAITEGRVRKAKFFLFVALFRGRRERKGVIHLQGY